MRASLCICAVIVAGIMTVGVAATSWSADYNSRFIRNYPPGYHGMWYNAERFFDTKKNLSAGPMERYRWDKYMSKITNVEYPFHPIPFPWDYGTGRNFNLPNYNSNDWP
jgi:hypothetical protein